MDKRVLVIGDIHGRYKKLMSLWDKVEYNPDDDIIVFLGDYIDRGPDSVKVLRFVKDLYDKKPDRVFPLMGNHEWMYLQYTLEKNDSWLMDCNGGQDTLSKFQELKKEELDELTDFIQDMECYLRVETGLGHDFIFAHAGLKPGVSLENQKDFDLLWIREEFYKNYSGDDIVVVGHTPTQYLIDKGRNTPAVLKNNIVMMDTGSYLRNGNVCCMDVLTLIGDEHISFWKSE